MIQHSGKETLTGKSDRIISMYDKKLWSLYQRFVNQMMIIDLDDNKTASVM